MKKSKGNMFNPLFKEDVQRQKIQGVIIEDEYLQLSVFALFHNNDC